MTAALVVVVLVMVAGYLVGRHGASRKTCPRCAEHVRRQAEVCRHCGHTFGTAPP